jgi:hypothetical protein
MFLLEWRSRGWQVRWVTYYRAVVIGRPVGPWRSERSQARRDLIAINLGEYDGDGIFFCTVPGDIEARRTTEAWPAFTSALRAR